MKVVACWKLRGSGRKVGFGMSLKHDSLLKKVIEGRKKKHMTEKFGVIEKGLALGQKTQ